MNGEKLNLTELAKQGLAGICILLIVLVAFMYYKTCETQDKVIELISNHFQHNTEIMEQLKSSVEDNIAVSQELKQILLNINGR